MTVDSIAEFYSGSKMGQLVEQWGREKALTNVFAPLLRQPKSGRPPGDDRRLNLARPSVSLVAR